MAPEPIRQQSSILEGEREVRRESILAIYHVGLVTLAHVGKQGLIAIVFDSITKIHIQVLQRSLIARWGLTMQLEPSATGIDTPRAAGNHDSALGDIS